ncbi:MAG: transporter [Gammaproteobacteria bacterium]|nr:transporter [Gammaproteobacteria bacterium]
MNRTYSAYAALIAAVVFCGATPVTVATTERYLEFSAGKSRGEFDTNEVADMYRLQLAYGQVSGRYDHSITASYLFLSDEFGDDSALGDVVLRGGIMFDKNNAAKDSLYVSLALKLPTGDESKGLSTGEADLGGFLNYTQHYKVMNLTLMGGYIVTGDSRTRSYDDILVYGISLSRQFDNWYVYGGLEGRQQMLDTSDDPLELNGGLLYQIQRSRFLTLEGIAGLNESSLDYGISVGIVNWF